MSNEVTNSELQEISGGNVKSYTNGDVTVYWRSEKCIHSANCIVGLPGVFKAHKRPWIDMAKADSEEVIKTVDSCPSRALLYMKNRGIPAPDLVKKPAPAGSAEIKILKNGPILISGNYILKNSENRQIDVETEIAAICRCGASRKKPFCDGNHNRTDFSD